MVSFLGNEETFPHLKDGNVFSQIPRFVVELKYISDDNLSLWSLDIVS